MNYTNFSQTKQSVNDDILQQKLDYHIQKVTRLRLLLDREEKLILDHLKDNKQKICEFKY